MKKSNFFRTAVFLLLLTSFLMLLYSCNKIVLNSPTATLQTVNRDIVLDSNTITLSAATKIAQLFLQSKNINNTVYIKNAQTIVKNGKPYFHVINANRGFVIISPDSCYVPILAYDSINNFSLEEKDINPGLVCWFNKHAHEIDFIRNTKSDYVDSINNINKFLWKVAGGAIVKSPEKPSRSNTIDVQNGGSTQRTMVLPPTLISQEPVYFSTNVVIGPLCQKYWYQGDPYNQFCPPAIGNAVTNGRAPTGCGAVAVAEVMAFWQYPNSYPWSIMAPTIDLTDPNLTPAVHPEFYTPTAQLMYDIGTTLMPTGYQFISYGGDGSSALTGQIPFVFSAFGYSNPGTSVGYNDSYTIFNGPANNSYANTILTEINSYQRPCIVSGFPDEGYFAGVAWVEGVGHIWVCDGTNTTTVYSGVINTYQDFYGNITTQTIYTDTEIINPMLHMYWGWGFPNNGIGSPNSDGWYNCSINYTLAPNNSNYQYFQQVVLGIQP